MKRAPLFFVLVGIAILASACGGGGGSSVVPHGGSAAQQHAGAVIHVTIPNNATGTSTRKPAFISSNTATLTIGVYTVNGATPSPLPTPLSIAIATSPDCSTASGATSCTITVTVPVATSVVLQISSYDASGNLLGQGLVGPIDTTLATIPTQSVSIGGVPAKLILSPAGLAAGDDGLTHPIVFGVSAQDASGNTIIPPGNYPNPIALSISGDPNGALSLSTTSVTSPGAVTDDGMTPVTLNYNSAKTVTQATITATYGSVTASIPFVPIVFTPTSAALLLGGSMQPVTVSEAGYSGAFTVTGTSSVATVTCVPANCTPSTAGGTVTIDIAPGTAAGSESVSVSDINGGFANIPVTNTASGGGGVLVGGPYKTYEYSTQGGGTNYGITVGSDGQTLWFLDRANAALGSVTNPGSCNTSCTGISEQNPFSQFSPPPAGLQAITAASDGNLYIADVGAVSGDSGQLIQISCPGGLCAPALSASVPSLPTPTVSIPPGPADVIAAPDGNLYATSASGSFFEAQIVGCCANGFSSQYFPVSSSLQPNVLTADQSGQTIWFTDTATGQVGFFPLPCMYCLVTEQPSTFQYGGGAAHPRVPRLPMAKPVPRHRHLCCGSAFATPLGGIVAAPDGNLYMAETGGNEIDQLNPSTWETCSGATCTYNAIALPVSGAQPINLVVGPDGNVWFTDATGYVGVIRLNTCATGCQASEYNVGGSPWGITAGPDGDIWFTDSSTNKIGKVVLQ